MKRIALSFVLAILLFCGACGLFFKQTYSCNADDVSSVQIISLNEYNKATETYDYTVISNIEDIPGFIRKLNDMEYGQNWGEPNIMEFGCITIMINYTNGNYDLLQRRAQVFYKDDNYRTGYLIFSEEPFAKLIEEYTEG